MHRGYIALWRKLLDWQWASDPNMVALWVRLLLEANHEDKKWQGATIKRGQVAVGFHSLSEKTGISVRSLRTCLQRLDDGGDISRKSTNRFTIVTICKYEEWQSGNKRKRQTTDKQTTNKRQQQNNYKNEKKEYSDQFEQFWNLYPRKIGKKKAAEAFDKANCGNGIFDEVLSGVKAYAAHLSSEKTDQRYIAHPTTWLNQERWTDEYSTSSKDEFFDPFAAAKNQGAIQ